MQTPDPIVPRTNGEIAIADLLDRALNKGLVLWGEATISVAGVDLVYLGLKLLLASTDTVNRMRAAALDLADGGADGSSGQDRVHPAGMDRSDGNAIPPERAAR
ncbi:MAG: hypothetical protein H6R00_1422 [Proteobacteria bacterium]|nr:hypothetical protein [Pseudomonadota bacterium]